jgi:hypothetical protein
MNYKTIVLKLLLERPRACRRLKRDRLLFEAVNRYEARLKADHKAITQDLLQMRPNADPTQIASEALEIALKDLVETLPSASGQADDDHHSSDRMMAFLRRHTLTA